MIITELKERENKLREMFQEREEQLEQTDSLLQHAVSEITHLKDQRNAEQEQLSCKES